jgi:hypothetical protein
MEQIIKSVKKGIYVDFELGSVNESMMNSLDDFLIRNLDMPFPDDSFELIQCANPSCNAVHAIRYYSESDDWSAIDLDSLASSLNQVLNDWAEEIICD